MDFNPSLKLSTYPNSIVIYFVEEAANMLRELEDNRLEVHLKPSEVEPTNKVRYAESHNPSWYSEFINDKCAHQSFVRKRKIHSYKNKTGGGIRQRTYKALVRIIRGNDGKLCGKHHSYDTALRYIIFKRLCDGYIVTIEGYANHPEGGIPAVIKIRNFFDIKTSMFIEPRV